MKTVSVYVAPPKPRGNFIIIWSGTLADIPSGWHLCDGQSGTPDLSDKFIISYYDYMEKTDEDRLVGEATATIDGHAHWGLQTDDEAGHQHVVANGFYMGQGMSGIFNPGSGGSSSHTHGGLTPPAEPHFHYASSSSYHADNVEVSTIPPYYSLAYLMGTGDIPVGSMCLMYIVDPYADGAIPEGYVICDGRNGTPDLWECYVVGAGGAFVLNETGGSYWAEVSPHQHSNGDVLITPEDKHTHAYGNNARWTFEAELPDEGAGITYGGGSSLGRYHDHQIDFDPPLPVAHTHPVEKPIVRDWASTYGDPCLPPSYKLFWILRVS